ncbi:SAM-dependent methyltransferase [Streptomyces sp. N2-109]|uniref:SAM-dependent methyltransferase n=1 Tax=Streptomyces gossypii TaxID=2883101 RepID=A0ABT2JVM8_9ACTN|nr:SAM-dependent methyltransferase [Streptomyces gossypii]MCT2591945.1 SAM-dependent methyltransferase [Streptomyces gossypii]
MTADSYDQQQKIDTTVPHSARIWNYWLGGRDHYLVDRDAGDAYVRLAPGIVDIARSSRLFLRRAVRHLVGEVGIRQFLDIGTGLPTADSTHEVAQLLAPECRVVYVDNDPLVLVHARALLTSTPEGSTTYVETDLHDPEAIVAEAAKTLDFDQPIGLIMLNALGHVADYAEARSIADRLVSALPSGSHLVLADGTNVLQSGMAEAQQQYNKSGALPYVLRTPEELTRYFDGLELLEPGVVTLPLWRPDEPSAALEPLDEAGGVGRKK